MSDLGQHDGDGIRYAMHLSAPKGGIAQMLRDPAGGWVSWEDYARLKAEVERLTYVDDFIVITKPSIKQLIEQGAQNTPGRYDKQYIIQVDRECYLKVLKHMAEFWEKAKEGKQP